MTTLGWFAVVEGLLIVGLISRYYVQVNIIIKLKAKVRKLIGEKPKNWNDEVKNVWSLDDE